MFNLIKSINRRTLILCLSIILTGIFSGIFSAAIIPQEDKLQLSAFLKFYFDSAGTALMPYILTNGLLLIIIILACFSIYGFPLALAVLLCRSFSTGFCGFLLSIDFGHTGIFLFLFKFLLPSVFFLALYLAVSSAGTAYALQNILKHN